MDLLSAICVGVLFGAGVDLMMRRDVVKLVAGTVLASNAAILLLVAGTFGATQEPLLPLDPGEGVADPIVQALALTAIVIGFGTTVLLLRIGMAIERTHETVDLGDLADIETRETLDDGEGAMRGPETAGEPERVRGGDR